MKRLFTLALGLGAGVVVGGYLVQRLERAQRAVAPAGLADRAGRTAGELVARSRAAVEEGRRAAAEREAELRSTHRVPSVRRALRE